MHSGARRPVWLATPSRYAGCARPRARWLLAIVALLMLAALSATRFAGAAEGIGGSGDAVLYDLVVEDIRHGADYYTATAEALRIADYPLRPFFVFRLPTLAMIQAQMTPVAAALLLYAMALLTLFAWWQRLAQALPALAPRALATLLAAIGMAGAVTADLLSVHEIWAGVLIALSLAVRRPDNWITAAALALSAMLIRETAILYAIVMAGAAWLEGRRRETMGWVAGMVVAAVVIAFHADAVGGVVRPLDQPALPWAGMPGFGFAIGSLVHATGLSLAPPAIGAMAAALTLVGWSAWRDPLAMRATGILLGYILLMAFAGRPGDHVWAYLIAPVAPIGLAFLPDAVRDLARAALDKRRITVTRTST